MEPLNVLIAPDFLPPHFAGWHMFNTVLQKRLGRRLHLLLPGDMKEQRQLFAAGRVDIAYASPFEAARLVRENDFLALVRPVQHADEMIIAASAKSAVQKVEDLRPGNRIAITPNDDVKLIGLRLLEPADLHDGNVQWVHTESYQGVTRLLLRGEADAGFFLADAFHGLANLTRSQLKILVESKLRDITHVFLLNPVHAEQLSLLQAALLNVGQQSGDQDVLAAMGIAHGFERIGQEDAEFMIDLMETLLD